MLHERKIFNDGFRKVLKPAEVDFQGFELLCLCNLREKVKIRRDHLIQTAGRPFALTQAHPAQVFTHIFVIPGLHAMLDVEGHQLFGNPEMP